MTTAQLIAEYGYWGEHLEYPLSDWHYAVNNNDTRLGYWDWVAREDLDEQESHNQPGHDLSDMI